MQQSNMVKAKDINFNHNNNNGGMAMNSSMYDQLSHEPVPDQRVYTKANFFTVDDHASVNINNDN